MPVDSKHPEYVRHERQWQRCRDVIAGQDAVRDATTDYLPMLSGQEDDIGDYDSYLTRAQFFNATGRTVDALTGTINAKPPVVMMPDALRELCADITLSGVTIEEFENQILENLIGFGRLGLLIDHPPLPTSEPLPTLARARALNLRPKACLYDALSIINWRTRYVGGVQVLTLVVLREMDCTSLDEFTDADGIQYRVADLGPAGYYRQRIFRKKSPPDQTATYKEGAPRGPDMGEGAEEYAQDGPDIYPLENGRRMTEIPFRFLNVDIAGPRVDTPPLLDLVDTNLAHYRNSADYEHGLHYTGLPQPWIAGVTSDPTMPLEFNIGSPNAWVFNDPQAKAAYLEFTGQGLKTLADALEAKERRMAVLGARMLMDEKKAAEAVEAIQIRFGGEHSVLASIARSASLGTEWMLRKLGQWAGIAGEVRYQLNTDYHASRMKSEMLTALIAAWQADGITDETIFQNLQKGDIIAVGEKWPEYQALLEAQAAKRAEAAAAAAEALAAAAPEPAPVGEL